VIWLAETHLQVIRRSAEWAYPSEACGLLLGQRFPNVRSARAMVLHVTGVMPTANCHPMPERGFEIDPAVQIDVRRRLRAQAGPLREELLGHFHSHPDTEIKPSLVDCDKAFEPELFWLIIGVSQGRAKDYGAWQISHDEPGAAVCLQLPIRIGEFDPRGLENP